MNGRWIDQFPPEREYDLEIDEDTYELQMADAAAAQAAADRAAESARRAEEIAQGLREEIPTKVSELENDSNYAVDANYVHTDNNFTSSEKNKLEGIAAGAEVNVNADWNATSGDAFILNKPTKVSDFDNDVGYLTEHQDISGKANSADLATVATSGSYNDLSNKPFIPSAVSDLTDDSGHYTKPANGIPATDMTSGVQTSLGLADTAYQKPNNGIPASDLASGVIPSVPVQDVQIKNTSILNNSVANIPLAANGAVGLVQGNNTYGTAITAAGDIMIYRADDSAIKNGNGEYKPIVPYTEHQAVFYGLAKAAGDTTQSQSENAVGTYTDEAKTAIQTMLNVPDKSDIPEVSVDDVQINGTSIVNDGVANIPVATTVGYGAMLVAVNNDLKIGTAQDKVITPYRQAVSVFYGLAKAAGTDERNSTLPVGQYTDNAKSAIQSMLGVTDSINNATSMLATVETTTTASKAYAVGDLLIYNGLLYKVTSAITLGSTIIPDGNVEQTTVEQELSVANNDVTDVQVNGTSVVQNGVANIPVASTTGYGAVKLSGASSGINSNNNGLYIGRADLNSIKAGSDGYRPITPINQHNSVFYGLAKAAGDTTQSASSNAVGTYTDSAKTAIQTMLNVPDKSDIPEVPVDDVQIDGTSIVSNGVASIPYASQTDGGVVKIIENGSGGFQIQNGYLLIKAAELFSVKAGSVNTLAPIVPGLQDAATFYGLAKAAGADEKNSALPAGQYTDAAKSAIHDMLNAPVTVSGTTPTIAAKSGINYVCGEVSTLTITLPASGIFDVRFTSGSTPTVLTTNGVTWPAWFDPTALEANTIYEINVLDGLAVVATWAT